MAFRKKALRDPIAPHVGPRGTILGGWSRNMQPAVVPMYDDVAPATGPFFRCRTAMGVGAVTSLSGRCRNAVGHARTARPCIGATCQFCSITTCSSIDLAGSNVSRPRVATSSSRSSRICINKDKSSRVAQRWRANSSASSSKRAHSLSNDPHPAQPQSIKAMYPPALSTSTFLPTDRPQPRTWSLLPAVASTANCRDARADTSPPSLRR